MVDGLDPYVTLELVPSLGGEAKARDKGARTPLWARSMSESFSLGCKEESTLPSSGFRELAEGTFEVERSVGIRFL